MYSSLQLAGKYLFYYLRASNGKGHGMHSPFVFDFILHVLGNGKNYQPPKSIEACRRELLQDPSVIERRDLGAGSRLSNKKQTIASLAKRSLKSRKYAELLFRLVKHYRPQNIVELGTSLGITTAYLSIAHPQANIITLEGDPSVAAVAKENFKKLECTNIKLILGNFDTLLSSVLSHLSSSLDLAFIDGNHRYEPTMRYFKEFLSVANEHTVLVFDDIHWSAEMEKAWEEIKRDPAVFYTIDIFFLGFVFFRKEFKVKQHFVIRF